MTIITALIVAGIGFFLIACPLAYVCKTLANLVLLPFVSCLARLHDPGLTFFYERLGTTNWSTSARWSIRLARWRDILGMWLGVICYYSVQIAFVVAIVQINRRYMDTHNVAHFPFWIEGFLASLIPFDLEAKYARSVQDKGGEVPNFNLGLINFLAYIEVITFLICAFRR